MKINIPTILLALSLSSLVGFSTGDEIELDSFLTARTSPNFLKYTKNVATVLPEGTRGEVVEIKQFANKGTKDATGNSGIKMKITSGPRAGESYWVYYNRHNPMIKLVENKTEAEVTPDKIELKNETTPVKPVTATTLDEVVGRRDMEEHAMLESARTASRTLDRDHMQDIVTPQRPPCVLDNNPVAENLSTYSPQNALSDINSGDLKFIGRELMPGSGQNRTCIYQNAKVYVLYNNCMSNRKEAPATDIEVISKQGGTVKFYVEMFNTGGKKMSKLTRDEYKSGTFSVVYTKTPPPGNLNVKKTIDFVKSNEINGNACFIGSTFKAHDMNTKATCIGGEVDKVSDWAPSAESFWKNPPQEWYTTQSKLRKLVETTPF